MAHNDEHGETNNVQDRLVVPILLPVVCLIITIALIVGIGQLLYAVVPHDYVTLAGEKVYYSVPVALGLALFFLLGFAFLASRAPDDDGGDSH